MSFRKRSNEDDAQKMEERRLMAQTLKELYLYPGRTLGENIARGLGWIFSWIVGIFAPFLESGMFVKALGGSYFIYALSMILEFYSEREKRKRGSSSVWFSVFFGSLIVITILSFILITLPSSEGSNRVGGLPDFLLPFLFVLSCFVTALILLGTFMSFIKPERFIFDEEAERVRAEEIEARLNREREETAQKAEEEDAQARKSAFESRATIG